MKRVERQRLTDLIAARRVADNLSQLRNTYSKFRSKISHRPLARTLRRAHVLSARKKGLIELPYPPEYLQLDVSGFCNLKCRMCPQSKENGVPEKGLMDLELFGKVVDDAAASGVFSLLLVLTGEPLINKQIYRMIRHGKEKGMRVHLSTNCTLLTKDVSKKLIETGLDEIILSFDSVKKEIYESLRCGAQYEEVLENVIGFLELRQELGGRTPYPIMQNLQRYRPEKPTPEIEKDFSDLFGRYGVWIMPKYFSNWSGIMEDHEKFYAESRIREDWDYQYCMPVYQRFVVSWDGKVLSCCNDFRREQVMGDVRAGSILGIWNGAEFRRLRRKIVEKEYEVYPLCKNCGDLWKPRV